MPGWLPLDVGSVLGLFVGAGVAGLLLGVVAVAMVAAARRW